MTKKRKKKNHKPIHELIFTDDELCQFWEWFNDHWSDEDWYYRAFYVGLILCTGLRMSEARQIKVEHCSTFPVPLIYIPKESAKQGKPREVEMLPQFEPLFVQRIMELRADWKRRHPHVTPFIFPGQSKWPNYKSISPETGDNWWTEVIEAAGLRYLPTHTGRRCFATYARKISFQDDSGANRYMSDMDLQQQLGHTDLATTAKCYVQSIPGSRFPRNGEVWAPKWPDKIGG
jgi:integrase